MTMAGNHPDQQRAVHFKVPVALLIKVLCGLPVFATFFCVVWSVVFDFEKSTGTHCRVPNFLPTISSAIGGFTPQRYVWRICIALHCAPRFMMAVAYYSYHTAVNVGHKQQLYKTLAALCALLHIIENFSLVILSYVSSTENSDIHEKAFISFMAFSISYMLLSIYVFSWGRSANGRSRTHTETKSLRYKVYLFVFNVSVFIFAVYLFVRHNTYCEPGVYTAFAACEYLTVLSNIAFHATKILDFEEYSFGCVETQLVHSRERKQF